jgi:hypothetical protein
MGCRPESSMVPHVFRLAAARMEGACFDMLFLF